MVWRRVLVPESVSLRKLHARQERGFAFPFMPKSRNENPKREPDANSTGRPGGVPDHDDDCRRPRGTARLFGLGMTALEIAQWTDDWCAASRSGWRRNKGCTFVPPAWLQDDVVEANF